jgi:hypothetical protein
MILMTAHEERQLALDRVMALRANPYDVLVSNFLDQPTHDEVTGASGTRYDVEVEAFWDKPRSPGQLRVRVAVDALPVSRRLHALTSEDFIIAPDGTFVGE